MQPADPHYATGRNIRMHRKRILIVTDAWHPQINGITTTLRALVEALKGLGADPVLLTPEGFRTIGLPTYPDIRLALATTGMVGRRVSAFRADYIHIATEGPLGIAARRFCIRNAIPFTTSYHTKLPEYVAARSPVGSALTYSLLRAFHNGGCGTFVSTESLMAELRSRGFKHLKRWSLGVDHSLFYPRLGSALASARPVFLSVGRLAIEKNLTAFLDLDLPGTKVVVGDGPTRATLEKKHPEVLFLGTLTGEALADVYASADVFVFPSRTDTFGLVLIEAMASGLPVASFPIPETLDIVGEDAGILDHDLRRACLQALSIPRRLPIARAQQFDWAESARFFLANLGPLVPVSPLQQRCASGAESAAGTEDPPARSDKRCPAP